MESRRIALRELHNTRDAFTTWRGQKMRENAALIREVDAEAARLILEYVEACERVQAYFASRAAV